MSEESKEAEEDREKPDNLDEVTPREPDMSK